MSAQEPPKIEFPCDYPSKVLGRCNEAFLPTVLDIFERHAPGFDRASLVTKQSSGGTFESHTLTIQATGPEQLSQLHEDLMATGMVSMVM